MAKGNKRRIECYLSGAGTVESNNMQVALFMFSSSAIFVREERLELRFRNSSLWGINSNNIIKVPVV